MKCIFITRSVKVASIYDVRKIFGFFYPLPPAPLSECYVLFVRKFGVFFYLCAESGRHIWKPHKKYHQCSAVVIPKLVDCAYLTLPR